jgi:hypothetical protein
MVKRSIADIVYSGPVRGYAHKSCRLERDLVEPNLSDTGAAAGCFARNRACTLRYLPSTFVRAYVLRAWSKKESDPALSELVMKYHASNAFEIAETYAFRNQPDKAFEWLDRAYDQRDPSLGIRKLTPC